MTTPVDVNPPSANQPAANQPESEFCNGCCLLETVYRVLFHPVALFERLQQILSKDAKALGNWLIYALLTVLVISALSPLLAYMAEGGELATLSVRIPIQAIVGLFCWLLMALVVGLVAYAWTSRTRFRLFLVLSGLSTLPWLFMAPINLIRLGLGSVGTLIGNVLALGVWLWSIVLFGLAIQQTYRLQPQQVVIVLLMPLVMSLVWFAWVLGFLGNLFQLLASR